MTADDVIFNRTDTEADLLAQKYFADDPFNKKVSPSLLSATDIVNYVKDTALINPFRANKKTLKHASYEGKIGTKAFIYDKRRKLIPLTVDRYLEVPANSIVFIESDVTFRLPRYIAARFNLQIKHVHRGLLLGTGPLVDPGFRGKLLIPLHNLTSETYYIHQDDGFIWIEFTRTTYDQDRPEPYGDYPDYKKISEVEKWLDKAAFDPHRGETVDIRSSIGPAVSEANKTAGKAIKVARKVQRYGIIGALTLFVTFGLIMLGEIYTNRTFMQNAYGTVVSESAKDAGPVRGAAADVSRFLTDVDNFRREQQLQLADILHRLARLEDEVAKSEQPSTVETSSSAQKP